MNQALIVGAGPTGLVLALALLQRGISVRIIDEKEGPSIHSKAFGIHARTLEIFAKLGVITSFLEKGTQVNSIIFHRGAKEYIFHLEEKYLSDTPYPFVLMLPQSETEQILIEAIVKLGGRVEWKTKLLSLKENLAALSTTENVPFDWLFGCDGGKSLVRHLVKLPFEGIELAENFLIVDVEGKANVDKLSAHFFFSKQGLMGLIPLRPALNRLIFPLKANEKIEENLQSIQFQLEKRGKDCLKLEKIKWFSYFTIHRRMVRTVRVGNCFLAGDAAHIHSPAGGQGMNTGIQDAFNLAWKVAQIIQGISPAHLIESYEQERLPIAKKVLKGTTLFTKFLAFVQKTGLFSLFFFVFFTIKKIAGRKLTRGLTELSVAYNKNSFIKKSLLDFFWCGPKSGERAPDVVLENGEHFFNYLNKTQAIVLLFEEREIIKNRGFETLVLKDARLMKAYHARKDSLYFIRPDGVIGYRAQKFNKKELEKYLLSIFY